MPKNLVRSLNCVGLFCPIPMIKTKKAIDALNVGDLLEIIATDPDVMSDITAWTTQAQHELLSSERQDGGSYRFLIRKLH